MGNFKHTFTNSHNILSLIGCLKNLEITSKICRLCCSHYLSAPGLSWDAMLKIIEIELELIPDLDIYIFFQKGARERISYISNRYSKASNKYLKSYDPKQESKHILYLDVNNLYGYAMRRLLLTSGLK